MFEINQIFIILASIGALLGSYSLLALRRDGWRKWGTPAAYGAVLAAMLVLTMLSFGQPRPIWTFFYDDSSYRIISWSYVENRAIYLWVVAPGSVDPIAISLPWNEAKAAKLLATMNRIKLNGQVGEVKPGAISRGSNEDISQPGDMPSWQQPLKEGEMGQ